MKRITRQFMALAALAFLGIAGCGADSAETTAEYRQSIETWRAERLARLKAPEGYLRLAGLYPLGDGRHAFGSAPDNAIVFPAGAAARIGWFDVADGQVRMDIADGVSVTVGGQPVGSIAMPDDTAEETVLAEHGSLAWSVINRQNRLFVRLRDYESAAVDALPPIPQYDIDRRWAVAAVLRPYDEPRVIEADTVIEGLGWNPVSPGVLEFEIDGETHTLEAYESSGGRLFIVFGDTTSGRETYPAGRFLYADPPDENGRTLLDFNKAYNPPCAFNDFSTCPVASPRNRLSVAVPAGEKFDAALHVGKASG